MYKSKLLGRQVSAIAVFYCFAGCGNSESGVPVQLQSSDNGAGVRSLERDVSIMTGPEEHLESRAVSASVGDSTAGGDALLWVWLDRSGREEWGVAFESYSAAMHPYSPSFSIRIVEREEDCPSMASCTLWPKEVRSGVQMMLEGIPVIALVDRITWSVVWPQWIEARVSFSEVVSLDGTKRGITAGEVVLSGRVSVECRMIDSDLGEEGGFRYRDDVLAQSPDCYDALRREGLLTLLDSQIEGR